MATKFLNRYGESLNEINYDNNQYALLDHTHSEYLPLSGGTCTGNVTFNASTTMNNNLYLNNYLYLKGNQRYYGINHSGGDTINYFKVAQIKILNSWANMEIRIDIAQRYAEGNLFSLYLGFSNSENNDPELNNFWIDKINTKPVAYINKSAAGVWDLYIKKSEAADNLNIIRVDTRMYNDGHLQVIEISNSTEYTVQSSWVQAKNRKYYASDIEVTGDVKINGSSVKAVIDFMNKYSSMLNIIGNNA